MKKYLETCERYCHDTHVYLNRHVDIGVGFNDNIIQCYYIHELIDFCTILIYVQTFFNSNMFEVFISLSNVKADGRIV